MRDTLDDVPLRDFLAFLRAVTHRAFFYCKYAFKSCSFCTVTVFYGLERIKDFLVACLIKRGGFFAPIPRLGLTTLTTTLVFSGIFVNSNFLQNDLVVEEILAEDLLLQQPEVETDVLSSTAQAPYTETSALREEVIEYTIVPGDTLSSLGEGFLVSVEALAYVNEISNEDFLSPGQLIKIPPTNGIIHTVQGGDTVSSIADTYQVSPQAIVDFNYLNEPYFLSIGQELVVPEAKIPQPVVTEVLVDVSTPGGLSLEAISGGSGTGSLTFPAQGKLSQYFSWYHPALDIATGTCGTQVVAADSGTIYFARWWAGGGGNTIMIDHGNGLRTKYAHLSGFAKTGGSVNKGEVIGYVGATGRAYGCHLHFVVEKGGKAVNPLSVL